MGSFCTVFKASITSNNNNNDLLVAIKMPIFMTPNANEAKKYARKLLCNERKVLNALNEIVPKSMILKHWPTVLYSSDENVPSPMEYIILKDIGIDVKLFYSNLTAKKKFIKKMRSNVLVAL